MTKDDIEAVQLALNRGPIKTEAQAAIAALEARGWQRVPEGWQVVPTVPDTAMLREWWKAHNKEASIETCFVVMLAAAPKPEEG